ncbi:unnamed protein product [Moneuplotes crassus]|uniref:Uncharacterized protein n=1 Tax=Euplotes crassus TaxID=5936 RepID=A0AAD1UM74_EUPCR|nr:unnamed protein product [Moneuplotes crassus]
MNQSNYSQRVHNESTQNISQASKDPKKPSLVKHNASNSLEPVEIRLQVLDMLITRVKNFQNLLELYLSKQEVCYSYRISQIHESLLKIKNESEQVYSSPAESQDLMCARKFEFLQMVICELESKLQIFTPTEPKEIQTPEVTDMKLTTENNKVNVISPAFSVQSLELGQKEFHPLACHESEISLEEQLGSMLSKLYADLYHSITGWKNEFTTQDTLIISLKKTSYSLFLKKMKRISLPCILGLYIENFNKHDRVVKDFSKNSAISKGCNSYGFSYSHVSNISFVLPEIVRTNQKMNERLLLKNFKINEKQLKRLFMTTKNKKEIEFIGCKLSLTKASDLVKCLKETSIESIDFSLCERSKYSNWVEKSEDLEYLIKGFSESDLRHSLQCVFFGWRCQMQKSTVTAIFKKYRLGHIEIKGKFTT